MRRRMRVIALLSLLGMPFYLLCAGRHVCMDGHMRHGPFPWYEWANDFLWMTCFAAVLVFSITLRARGRMWFLCGSLLLIFLRIPVGDAGGVAVIVELPLMVVMAVFSVLYLANPGRWTTPAAEPDGGPESSETVPGASPDERSA